MAVTPLNQWRDDVENAPNKDVLIVHIATNGLGKTFAEVALGRRSGEAGQFETTDTQCGGPVEVRAIAWCEFPAFEVL